MLLALVGLSAATSHQPQKNTAPAIVSCVDWCGDALAESTCVHSIHDVSAGAAGNPNHDNVFPPTTYDIVDAMNLARKELGAPLNRAWWCVDHSVPAGRRAITHTHQLTQADLLRCTDGYRDGSVVLDWPVNSSTPDRKTVWCPAPTAPNSTAKTTSWDFSAMDVKILNLQGAVPYPETTILQANLECGLHKMSLFILSLILQSFDQATYTPGKVLSALGVVGGQRHRR